MDAEELALDMAAAMSGREPHGLAMCKHGQLRGCVNCGAVELLPYARALIQAEKALDAAALSLRLAAGCITRDETRIAAHVNADAASAALLALRAVIGEP